MVIFIIRKKRPRFLSYEANDSIKRIILFLVFLMMATALLWAASDYKFCHFFENFFASSELSNFKWLLILNHKMHESKVLFNIPVSLWFSVVDTAFFLFQSLLLLSLNTLAILMAQAVIAFLAELKVRWLFFFLFGVFWSIFPFIHLDSK